jgi:hypothetical protein
MIQCKVYLAGYGDVYAEDYIYFYAFTSEGVVCKGYYLGDLNVREKE